MKYSLTALNKDIYLLQFDNRYDLAIHFLRYQEYYESPNASFRGHSFELVDYIEWYSKKNDNIFSYADDWSGFNIPGTVLEELFELEQYKIKDFNRYDRFMKDVYDFVKRKSNRFYLIGCKFGDKSVVEHEIAHALYYTNPEYKKSTADLVASLNIKVYGCLQKRLASMGYTGQVIQDEMQAYLSTGLNSSMKKDLEKILEKREITQLQKPFKQVFKDYYKQLDLDDTSL